ncbi:hypothetical protein LIER_23272 [Lithospermum erythrorhizon]|uniref:Retrotransposon Copia-like N-terminal domain-containing protein n=1 Tax=Lithospermum erythrorhizon TaxID=34254 RepID=A0AAV3QZ54_LITER
MASENDQTSQNQNQTQNQNQSKNSQNNHVTSAIKTNDPLFLHSSNHSSFVLSCSRAMKVAMEARDKYGFLNGEIEAPSMEDVRYKQWRKVNSTLISWIMNALSKDISRAFVFTDDAKMLWEDIRDPFGGSNGSRVFEL